MKRKKLFIIILIGVGLLMLLIGKKAGWYGAEPEGVEVETQKIVLHTISQKVSATGKVQPELEIKISSEVSGEIIELPMKEGQSVKKGDLLVRINPDVYQSIVNRSVAGLENVRAALKQAEASLKESEESYNRSRILFEKGVISKSDWDKAVSSYEIAKANKESVRYNVQSAMASVSEANDNLKKTTIFSPATGTISKLNVELGERVVGTLQMTGTEIMRVADLSQMEVEVDVNENDIIKINVGNQVDIEVDAYPKKVFKGSVTNIANTANSTTSTDQVTNFKVTVRIDEASYKELTQGKKEGYSPFRPGMTATVDILTQQKSDIVAVPISAIVVRKMADINPEIKGSEGEKRQEAIFVFKDGKAMLRAVTTGIQDNTNIEVLSGVSKDEEIIIGPYSLVSKTLKNNDIVIKKENKK